MIVTIEMIQKKLEKPEAEVDMLRELFSQWVEQQQASPEPVNDWLGFNVIHARPN